MSANGRAEAARIRLLILDHYFGQDIEALSEHAGERFELRTISYNLLRAEALRVFPDVTASGLEGYLAAYAAPDLEPARREWERRTVKLLEEQFSVAEFDAFISPSDIFFYVRSAPEACHRLGIPFVVVQKETTIPPYAMDADAYWIRDHAPPVADLMTVCSERHREFELRCGADPGSLTITGQPRFDFYAEYPDRVEAGYGEGGPVALFFSYQLDMYHPEYGDGDPIWLKLHTETEAGLLTLVERGWRILIKPHPQQAEDERRRIARAIGGELGKRIFLIDAEEDSRRLIAGADAVIGFQSTALLEGMLAGRPVVYTGWDPEAKRLQDGFLPFHEWGAAITVVDSASELADAVERAAGAPASERARQIASSYLGPVDGESSRRTLDAIAGEVARFEAARSPEVAGRRREVGARRPPLALGRKTRGGIAYVRDRISAAIRG